jgi:acetyltransferase EpsM
MKNIFFYGCSGFFKEQFVWVKDFLSSNKNQYTLAGIIDDPKSIYLKKDNFSGLNIFKLSEIPKYNDIEIHLSIGEPVLRERAIEELKEYKIFSYYHPSAVVSPYTKIGKGVTISPKTIIAGDAIIGDYNVLNFGSMVSHDCIINQNNIFSPGVKIMGNCKIGNNNFFGVDAKMIPATEVIDRNRIGANCVITKNFSSDHVLVGTPAKVIKKSNYEKENS